MDMNSIQLVGRLADNVSYSPASGERSSRAVGRLIVNRRPSQDGKRRYDAIQFVAWGKNADNLAAYTSKGKELGLTGELRVNNIRPEKEGDPWKNYTEVLIHHISFGRDSNQQKMQKALQGGDLEAVASLSGINFADLFSQNPELLAAMTSIAQPTDESKEAEAK